MTTAGATGPAKAGQQHQDLTTDHPLVRLMVGIVTAVAVVLVLIQHRADQLTAMALAAVVLSYGVLSAIDISEQRLPNQITLPLAALTTVGVITLGAVGGEPGRALTAIAVGLGFAVVLFILRFGMGDVKLALTVGMIAGWFGRDAILATTYIGAAAGAFAALVLMLVYQRRDIAFGFGPILAIGSVAGMLVAA